MPSSLTANNPRPVVMKATNSTKLVSEGKVIYHEKDFQEIIDKLNNLLGYG
jgi:hypothetical protein